MAQVKCHRLQSTVEPLVYRVLVQETRRIGMDTSHYIRMLILKDLRLRGALEEADIAKLAIGQ
jgi:hypothetical protein